MAHQKTLDGWLCRQLGVLPHSALRYTLEALVPYSEANLNLVFSPNRFFNELDTIDRTRRYRKPTITKAYYEAKRRGYILIDEQGCPRLSPEAKNLIRPYRPSKRINAQLMVVFDIPEDLSVKRRWFRLLLHELKFVQIQKSVWVSDYDCVAVLSAGILEQRLEDYVRIYEARAIEEV